MASDDLDSFQRTHTYTQTVRETRRHAQSGRERGRREGVKVSAVVGDARQRRRLFG